MSSAFFANLKDEKLRSVIRHEKRVNVNICSFGHTSSFFIIMYMNQLEILKRRYNLWFLSPEVCIQALKCNFNQLQPIIFHCGLAIIAQVDIWWLIDSFTDQIWLMTSQHGALAKTSKHPSQHQNHISWKPPQQMILHLRLEVRFFS